MKELINLPVKIFMHNGQVFRGILKSVQDECIELLSVDGDMVKIFSKQYIDAVSFKPSNQKEEPKELTPTDVPTLVELRKMKAQSEIDEVRRTLRRNTPTAQPTEYTSILHSIIKK